MCACLSLQTGECYPGGTSVRQQIRFNARHWRLRHHNNVYRCSHQAAGTQVQGSVLLINGWKPLDEYVELSEHSIAVLWYCYAVLGEQVWSSLLCLQAVMVLPVLIYDNACCVQAQHASNTTCHLVKRSVESRFHLLFLVRQLTCQSLHASTVTVHMSHLSRACMRQD